MSKTRFGHCTSRDRVAIQARSTRLGDVRTGVTAHTRVAARSREPTTSPLEVFRFATVLGSCERLEFFMLVVAA